MPGPLGILDQLTPAQQDDLFALLKEHPIHVVRDKIAAHPPEGWCVQTHATSLARFYNRKKVERLRADITDMAESAVTDAETETFKASARNALIQHACQGALGSAGDPQSLKRSVRLFLELEKLDARALHLKLMRDRLELEKQKATFNAIFKSTSAESAFATEEMRDMLRILKKEAVPGGLLDPSRFTGFQ